MWVLVVLGCKRAFNEKATHMGQEVEERGELSQVAEGKVFPEGSIGSDTQDSKCMQTSDTRGTCLIGRGSWWCPPGWLRTCRNQSREHPSLSQPGRKQEFNLFLPLLLHHMKHCIREFTSMFSIFEKIIINGQGTGDFYGSETTLYGTIMVDTCHSVVVQYHKTKCESRDKLWTLGVSNMPVEAHPL